ncbi:MAG: nuclear transport factor 2 family protein [bacterium]|nr:nuclear transport factor 2 family protein [bacterium]
MRKTIVIGFVSFMLVSVGMIFGGEGHGNDKERAAIKKVIEAAYVKGIHIDRDIPAIRKGFHADFSMLMPKKEDKIDRVSIDKWIGWIEEGKKKNPGPKKYKTTHKFSMVDVTGNAAVAKIEIYRDGKHTFTDYMSLYKFSDGWKIVNKIYFTHK